MRYKIIAVVIMTGLMSCNSNHKFSVEGTVKDAENKVLYIEHNGLLKNSIIDSVVLDKNGDFTFTCDAPLYPDFYSLKLDGKQIIFAIDSIEKLTISSTYKDFAQNYKIEGSQTNTDIQLLRKSIANIQTKANKLDIKMPAAERNSLIAEIDKDLQNHKQMAQQIILKDTRSTAAYFALYQKLGNSFVYNPYQKDDRVFFSAVATAYNTYMPEYERTKNIYGLVLDALKAERKAEEKKSWKEFMDKAAVGFFDIELNDVNAKPVKLSSLQGKVILVDFSAYEMENSVDYIFGLRGLYNKYHSKGLEIYQVSLDNSKLFWEQSVQNIPWVCVRDEDGPASRIASTYAVSILPTMFIINRQGNLIGRDYSFKTADLQISKLLK